MVHKSTIPLNSTNTVTSINGETGAITLTSPSGTIAIGGSGTNITLDTEGSSGGTAYVSGSFTINPAAFAVYFVDDTSVPGIGQLPKASSSEFTVTVICKTGNNGITVNVDGTIPDTINKTASSLTIGLPFVGATLRSDGVNNLTLVGTT